MSAKYKMEQIKREQLLDKFDYYKDIELFSSPIFNNEYTSAMKRVDLKLNIPGIAKLARVLVTEGKAWDKMDSILFMPHGTAIKNISTSLVYCINKNIYDRIEHMRYVLGGEDEHYYTLSYMELLAVRLQLRHAIIQFHNMFSSNTYDKLNNIEDEDKHVETVINNSINLKGVTPRWFVNMGRMYNKITVRIDNYIRVDTQVINDGNLVHNYLLLNNVNAREVMFKVLNSVNGERVDDITKFTKITLGILLEGVTSYDDTGICSLEQRLAKITEHIDGLFTDGVKSGLFGRNYNNLLIK